MFLSLAADLVDSALWSYPLWAVGKRRYRRQERSLIERLREHVAKVEAEQAKNLPDEGLIRYWEREIKAFEAGIARARRRLRSKS